MGFGKEVETKVETMMEEVGRGISEADRLTQRRVGDGRDPLYVRRSEKQNGHCHFRLDARKKGRVVDIAKKKRSRCLRNTWSFQPQQTRRTMAREDTLMRLR